MAAGVTQETNDKKQLIPMMKKVKENTRKLPGAVSADAGYFSETNVTAKSGGRMDLGVSDAQSFEVVSQRLDAASGIKDE